MLLATFVTMVVPAQDRSSDGFRAIGLVKALRLLTLISRMKELRVMADAIIKAVPRVILQFLVMSLVLFVFSAVGVNLFGGRFGLRRRRGRRLAVEVVNDKAACANGYEWVLPRPTDTTSGAGRCGRCSSSTAGCRSPVARRARHRRAAVDGDDAVPCSTTLSSSWSARSSS